MIVYPHAKINLGLHILGKRSDGYHNIETVIYPIGVCDILEVRMSQQPQLFLYGWPVEGAWQDNLCMKAYHMLCADFDLPPVQFHLYKQIPVGAGLGGGSSDGASALRLLNDFFSLGINDAALEVYASRLGSDCPALLYHRPCLASGRGEVLCPFDVQLADLYILVCKPDLFISTAQAYAKVQPQKPERTLREALSLPVQAWKECVVNDFERALFPQYPVLREYKEQLYASGAVYASLSGSGSALYGIYTSKDACKEAYGLLLSSGMGVVQ